MTDFRAVVEELFMMVQENEEAPAWALGLKLSEETGEFSEVLLHDLGFLKHKDKEFEPLIEEAADVFNVIIGVLARRFPDENPIDLTEDFLQAVQKKGAKYAKLMGVENEYSNFKHG